MNLSLKKIMIMSSNLLVNESRIAENMDAVKLLGVTIDHHISFHEQATETINAASKRSHGLLVLKQSGVNQESLVMMYNTCSSTMG